MAPKKNKRYIIIVVIILTFIAGIKLFQTYQTIYGSNVTIETGKTHFYIPTGSDFNFVKQKLFQKNVVVDTSSFVWVARKKNYASHIHPGRYLIQNGMSNNELINLLRSGKQEPVSLIFNNVRTKEALASRVAEQIEADSAQLIKLLSDQEFLEKYGFSNETVLAMFLPNTYEFWWDTSAEEFIKRMHREYDRFWTEEKRKKASRIDLTPVEVTTLASIVDEETLKDDEMDKIAGVYINRLNRGMRLQADPTVKFAIGDFSVKRVLDKHLAVESPYNTYKYRGLPPGPISIPSIAAIRAVLNYENHDYLYFCAKPDFSGYHNFSKTHYQHILNARKYQQALNERRIWQ
jgi:UPF0755 protein